MDGTLRIIDISGVQPTLVGSLNIEHAARDMVMAGDTVLVLGAEQPRRILFEGRDRIRPPETTTAVITAIDISGEPELVTTTRLDGSYVSARLIDDTVRVVISSLPTGFVFTFPEANGLKAERDATEANRTTIEESTEENWIPWFITSDGAGNVIAEGTLVECERAHHPAAFSGFGMLSVVTFDLSDGVERTDAVGVMTSGSTVYSSTAAMYVTTNRWLSTLDLADEARAQRAREERSTEIHKFDITAAGTEYAASGVAAGTLLNQFSISEHEGNLRIVLTENVDTRISSVTVFTQDGRDLTQIGHVSGIGKRENVQSVRFVGDMGYVVTFRQTDPLFTIDLSDPTNPVVRGELEIPGFSSYLHPLSDERLIGIGRDGNEAGRLKGMQVSLFDVSDPEAPIRLQKISFPKGRSEAELDQRAFVHWEPAGLTLVPLTDKVKDEAGKNAWFEGAVGLDITDEDIIEIGRISHGDIAKRRDSDYLIRRSIVVGESIYTVSAVGIMKSTVVDLLEEAWLGF